MKSTRTLALTSAMFAIAIATTNEAYAQTCNNSSYCVYMANSGSGLALHAVGGSGAAAEFDGAANQAALVVSNSDFYGTSDAVGIDALGINGAAVFGQASGSGQGVLGQSNGSNGVEGVSYTTGASGVYGHNDSSGGGGYGVAGRASGTGVAVYGDNTNSSGWSGYFTGKVYAGSGYSSSDARLKTNIKPMSGALDDVLKLHGVTFEWKDAEARGAGVQMGFVAQDVEKVYPQWVTTDPTGFKAINTKGVEPLLVEGVRSLKAENDALRLRTGNLEERLSRLEGARRMSIAGFGQTWIGLGLAAVAGALIARRRRERAAE